MVGCVGVTCVSGVCVAAVRTVPVPGLLSEGCVVFGGRRPIDPAWRMRVETLRIGCMVWILACRRLVTMSIELSSPSHQVLPFPGLGFDVGDGRS